MRARSPVRVPLLWSEDGTQLTVSMHYLYILQSKRDKSFYTGVTNDIQRRLKEHNAGLSRSTKNRIPWMIAHTEEFESIIEAYQRERYIKSRKKRKYIESIINVRARSSAG